MTKEEAFKQIKQIGKALDNQVLYDSKENVIKSDFTVLEPKTDRLAPGMDGLMSAIKQNGLLMSALNLDAHHPRSHFLCHSYSAYDLKSALTFEELDSCVDTLITRGCRYTVDKADYNTELLDKIEKLRNRMNDVNVINH